MQFRELEVADLARKQFIVYRGFMRPELELEHWFPTEVADYLQDFYEDLLAGKRPKVEGSETAG